jgi:hypothetical protein
VQLAGEVYEGELALPDSVTEPMKAHADTHGLFLLDCVGG